MRAIAFFLMVTLAGAWGCGGEGSDADATAGASGASGGGSGGGAGAGAGGSAAQSAGGGSGAGASGDALACTPGFTADGSTLYPYPFDNCGAIPGLDEDVSARDLSLPNPIGPGDTYAFSAKMNTGGGRFQIYGATEKCGEAFELLDTVEVTRGDVEICHQASPVTGTYTHLLWTWGAAAQQDDTTFCEGGTCPGR